MAAMLGSTFAPHFAMFASDHGFVAMKPTPSFVAAASRTTSLPVVAFRHADVSTRGFARGQNFVLTTFTTVTVLAQTSIGNVVVAVEIALGRIQPYLDGGARGTRGTGGSSGSSGSSSCCTGRTAAGGTGRCSSGGRSSQKTGRTGRTSATGRSTRGFGPFSGLEGFFVGPCFDIRIGQGLLGGG